MLIKTRKLKTEDFDQIYNLLSQLYNNIEYSVFKDKYNTCLDNNSLYGIVATADKKVIGVILYRIIDDLMQNNNILLIDSLIVDERFRGKGIGTLLLKNTISFATENNCKIAELISNISDEKANSFCENNGFQKTYYKFKKSLK